MSVTKTILALTSLALLGRVAAAQVKPRQTLEQLCRLDKHAPQVTRISEVRSLAAILEEGNSSGCDTKVAEAIKRLVLVFDSAGQNVCSPGSIDSIMEFWREFVANKKQPLLESLKRFFLVYSLQVSKRCRELMRSEIIDASKKANIENHEEYNFVIDTLHRLEDIFDGDFQVERLLGVVGNGEAINIRELMMKVIRFPSVLTVDIAHDECRRRYMPVYNALIMPVLRLASIGINYRDIWDSMKTKPIQKRVQYMRWFTSVMICESIQQNKSPEAINKFSSIPTCPFPISAQIDDLIMNDDDTDMKVSLTRIMKGDMSEVVINQNRVLAWVTNFLKRQPIVKP